MIESLMDEILTVTMVLMGASPNVCGHQQPVIDLEALETLGGREGVGSDHRGTTNRAGWD
jgi:hypothetical protein